MATARSRVSAPIVIARSSPTSCARMAGWLESHLRQVGDEVFGRGKFRIDRKMKKIKDHFHQHARPI